MIDHGKHNVLGVLIDAVDYEAAVHRIIQAAEAGSSYTTTALAVHGVMTGVSDRQQRYRLNNLNLVVPDGQPVRWALNWLYGLGLSDRVYGPSLMLCVCEAAAQRHLPVFLYGSRQPVLDALVTNLQAHFPSLPIAGVEASKFRRLAEEEANGLVTRIRGSGAALVFVGLGCPRQETWVYEFGPELMIPTLAVGAAFDFHAGLLPQAPSSWQRYGLEWLYRLGSEPRRLWRRYLLLNPCFLSLLAFQLVFRGSFPTGSGVQPDEKLRFG